MDARSMPALTMDSVAAMDRRRFIETFGELFEHSPWIADAAWELRPFASPHALHEAMMSVLRTAPPSIRIAFLNLHPELAGREAEAGTMTGASTFEQQGAGLDALSRDELQSLRALNAAYRQRHGFPFIIKVLGCSKAQIFDALRSRTANDTPAEIDAALQQVALISRRRLDALLLPKAAS